MDITMPGMEGIDALEMIIRDDSRAKIIMVSSLGHHQLVKDALKKGPSILLPSRCRTCP